MNAEDRDRTRFHYELEKKLANHLRHSTKEERPELYVSLYNELFSKVPEMAAENKAESARYARQACALLRRFITPSSVFLEIGAGGGALSALVAPLVKKVYALEVSAETIAQFKPSSNTEVVLAQGVEIPLAADSVDCAFSTQVLEHIHPDDALDHVQNVVRVLKNGGVYVCLTPHRYSGPHDVSRAYDTEATGFHLKEYTIRELIMLFKKGGLRDIQVYANVRGWYVRYPLGVAYALEQVLGILPRKVQQLISRLYPVKMFFGITIVGKK